MRSFIVFAGLVLAAGGLIGTWLDRGGTAPLAEKQPAATAAVASVQPASSGLRSVTIPRDARGHFHVEGRIDGRRVGFMVDTGASVIALTEREAGRLGIRPMRNDYIAQVRTANGVVKAAPVTLNMVDIDGLVVRDVQALVVPGDALGENLLGLSYLTRLKRFEYARGKLVLEN
jgi:aspartyl protease family protein